MVVVADTTPIRHLAAINQIHILKELYGRITVPLEVWTELQHAETPEEVRLWVDTHPDWIDVRTVSITPLDESLSRLHEGERNAILLAELRAQLLVVDDQAGRYAAKARGIETTGTLGVPELADDRGLIPDFLQALTELKESGFWAADRLWDQMRERRQNRMRDRDCRQS